MNRFARLALLSVAALLAGRQHGRERFGGPTARVTRSFSARPRDTLTGFSVVRSPGSSAWCCRLNLILS
jgi:hypothetical protein